MIKEELLKESGEPFGDALSAMGKILDIYEDAFAEVEEYLLGTGIYGKSESKKFYKITEQYEKAHAMVVKYIDGIS